MGDSGAHDDGGDCLVKFVDVHKKFGEDASALRGLNLDIHTGEFLTLLGPSGGGKSTALMMLAGFDSPTSGDILYRGQSIAEIPAHRRNFGVVFQSRALFPHLSALLNVACREIRLQTGLMTFLAHPMVPPDQGGESAPSERGMGVHGGHLETSLMLHLAPDRVRMDLATARVPDIDNRHVRFGGPVTFGWTSDDFGEEGHIGDPTGATADIGSAEFRSIVDTLAVAFDEIRQFELDR